MNNYEEEVDLPFKLPTRFYGAMLAVWQMRKDLQNRFPLHSQDELRYQSFLAWCTLHGRREYAALRQLSAWDESLSNPGNLPTLEKDPLAKMFTTGMSLLGIAQYDDIRWPILCRTSARRSLWRKYWRKIHAELKMTIPEWQLMLMARYYDHSIESMILDIGYGFQRRKILKNPALYIRKYNLEKVAEYFQKHALQSQKGSVAPETSAETHNNAPANTIIFSNKEMRLGKIVSYVPQWLLKLFRFTTLIRLNNTPASAESAVMKQIAVNSPIAPQIHYPFGVNLFGYAQGELGQGEDLRMLAATFDLANIPFCIINIRPGNNISQNDNTVDHWISEQPKFGINIFCMTGIEHLRYYLQCGKKVFEGRYTIGLWPWELPSWPDSWAHVYTLVDEIWGISAFTSNAYKKAPIPITTMPLPVLVEPIAEKTRKDFGLPEQDYLFIYSFDLSSTLTRKNPQALIDAFLLAFPQNEEELAVGLVLKINNVEKMNLNWRRIKKKVKDDRRIKIIEGTFARDEVLALYKCCNCFVSLHRSEGFGRGIVESLMLDLDVIATGYSGNMDYSEASRLLLVDFTLRGIKEDEYFLPNGQSWAEPSISQSAKYMRQLTENSRLDRDNYKAFERYLPATVSATYEQKLHLVFEKHKA